MSDKAGAAGPEIKVDQIAAKLIDKPAKISTEKPTLRVVDDTEAAKLAEEVLKLRQQNTELANSAASEMRIKMDAWAKNETLVMELIAVKAELAALKESGRVAVANAAEHLLRRRKAEALTDPLRAEISMAHRSINELRGELLQAGQLAETKRQTIAGLTQKLDAAGSTLAMMQAARDKAQAERDQALRDKYDAVALAETRFEELAHLRATNHAMVDQGKLAASEILKMTGQLDAIAAAHRKGHPEPEVQCALCRALEGWRRLT